MNARPVIQHAIRRLGYTITRLTPATCPDLRRALLLETQGVTVVLDVGANTGQYGRRLRESGYQRRIASFEPLPGAFQQLEKRARQSYNWSCEQVAVGKTNGTTVINISRNSVSSSILPSLTRLTKVEPRTAYVGSIKVPLRRLDSIVAGHISANDRLWLKLDVQGYEAAVLDGAGETLSQTRAVEAELSLVPLYQGQVLYREMMDRLEAMGFSLIALERGFSDYRTGHVLQVDAIFARPTNKE